MLQKLVAAFWTDEGGQDLAEYCLLTALLALVACAIFVYTSGGIHNLWTGANNALAGAPGASNGNGSEPSH